MPHQVDGALLRAPCFTHASTGSRIRDAHYARAERRCLGARRDFAKHSFSFPRRLFLAVHSSATGFQSTCRLFLEDYFLLSCLFLFRHNPHIMIDSRSRR